MNLSGGIYSFDVIAGTPYYVWILCKTKAYYLSTGTLYYEDGNKVVVSPVTTNFSFSFTATSTGKVFISLKTLRGFGGGGGTGGSSGGPGEPPPPPPPQPSSTPQPNDEYQIVFSTNPSSVIDFPVWFNQ